MSQFEPGLLYNRRDSLRLDSLSGQTDDEASNVSPSSTTDTNSPNSAFLLTSASSVHHSHNDPEEEDKDPSSGPQRQSSSVSGVKSDKEKRKRSRVTPEQLVRLERFFATDRSPTAARRREISETLGMQERQTQIWFQNRRAKAKLQDGKDGSRGASMELCQDIPPEIPSMASFEVDLQSLIYEDESVAIIPCTDLTVGTWHRIASSENKHDLIAYVSERKRCLNWFIHSDGYGFKMEIPFEIVVDAQFQPAGLGSGLANFSLSQPPIFYIENVCPPYRADGTPSRGWKRCSDWTQGHQATEVLRHTLMGSSVQLTHIVRALHAHNANSTSLPTYRSDLLISRPMEIPPPPLVGLNSVAFQFSEFTGSSNPGSLEHLRKRSSHSALENRYSPDADIRLGTTSQSAPDGMKDNVHLPHNIRSTSTVPDAHPTASRNYPSDSNQVGMLPGYSMGTLSRSYSMQPHRYYNNGPRALQNFQSESDSPGGSMLYDTSSPRLLTTPYHPVVNVPTTLNRTSSPQAPSNMAGIIYEVDEDLRNRRSH